MGNVNEVLGLIKANVNVIQIVSYETLRIQAILVGAARKLKRELYKWDCVEGIKSWKDTQNEFEVVDESARSVDAVFNFYKEHNNCILLLEDFYPALESNPQDIRRVRNAAKMNEHAKKTLVISQPFQNLHFALEKEVHVLELPYPGIEEITSIYKHVCKEYRIRNASPDMNLLKAALGLTTMEVKKAFSLAYITNKALAKNEVELVIKEKENVIKKSGYMEYYHPEEKIEDVGGLNNLKSWLVKRGSGFKEDGKKYGLTYPRGILLLGIPGTGKSLMAKVVSNMWLFPLLRFDMAKILGGIVGQPESNIRGALNIAEAISPCVLWIDEIEKAMSGMSSSGSSDGGITSRALGTFLTWMQDKKKPVFVVATVNDISKLPLELLRKGRVDEIFFVDLPTQSERETIFSIHLERKKRDPRKFDIGKLANATSGFSGLEIEEVIKEAMFSAFDKGKEVVTEDIIQAIEKTSALSRTMHETIEQMRDWAKSRAVSASSEEPEKINFPNDRIIPKLKQERYDNPFI
jgi:ATP-dependent 26S proteasome regulatory subunit